MEFLAVRRLYPVAAAVAVALLLAAAPARSAEPTADFITEIKQITFGPQHHFFGYIGHVQTIPWNKSGRYIVGLRTGFQDRMPKPGEEAEIVLLDTQNGYAERVVDQTRAWELPARDDALLEPGCAGDAVLLQRPRPADEPYIPRAFRYFTGQWWRADRGSSQRRYALRQRRICPARWLADGNQLRPPRPAAASDRLSWSL